jgi:type IV fimbrial biogenesis protein FimT
MNRQRGFTLIELIITVVIVVILLTVGVPSFQEMMRNNRAATQANEFLTALNFARSEAVKRGRNVSLCPSTDQASCSGTDWSGGWIAFVNPNGDATVDTGEVILRVWEALSGNPTFTGPSAMGYQPTGQPVGGATQFDYALGTHTQCVLINAVGRPHVEKDDASCP